jgi:hypothetical protein
LVTLHAATIPIAIISQLNLASIPVRFRDRFRPALWYTLFVFPGPAIPFDSFCLAQAKRDDIDFGYDQSTTPPIRPLHALERGR